MPGHAPWPAFPGAPAAEAERRAAFRQRQAQEAARLRQELAEARAQVALYQDWNALARSYAALRAQRAAAEGVQRRQATELADLRHTLHQVTWEWETVVRQLAEADAEVERLRTQLNTILQRWGARIPKSVRALIAEWERHPVTPEPPET